MQNPLRTTVLPGEQPSSLILGIDKVSSDLTVEGEQLHDGLCYLAKQHAPLPILATEVVLVSNSTNNIWDVFAQPCANIFELVTEKAG